MKTMRSTWVALFLAGCASSTPDSSPGVTMIKVSGPPAVMVTLPGRVSVNDLANGMPPIRIDGPPEITASLILFSDTDGNNAPGAGEYKIEFRALPDPQGLSITGVRLTQQQIQTLGRFKKYGVEVNIPGKDKPLFFPRKIE
jgi:hypothetical protein